MTSLEFVNPSGNLTLDESQIISLNPVLVHTGKGDLRATVEETRSLDDYAQRQDRLNLISDGSTIWTGYLVGVSHNERQGTSVIRADGIAKRLEETRPDYESIGGPVQYTDVALHDAISDYWGRTEFSNYTVTDQNTSIVATDSQLQKADTDTEFNNLLSIGANEPFNVSGGALNLAQSGFIQEAENATDSFFSSIATDSGASNGEAGRMNDAGNPHYFEYDFTLDYEIPSDSIYHAWRMKTSSDTEQPGYRVLIDGTEVFTISKNWAANPSGYEWWDQRSANELSGVDIGSLSSGTHTIRWEIAEETTNDEFLIADLGFVYDNRFSYNFDSTVDSDGYLSGPELYPTTEKKQLSEAVASLSIDEATVNLTIDDTTGGQEIALSFDSGSTFQTSSNTTTFTASPTGATRSVLTRLGLSRYGSRTTATPTEGYLGQSVDIYELLVDLSDLVVVDELELSRNHFDNLQALHNYGNFFWNIAHDSSDISNLVVSSFQEGDETKASPSEWDNPQNINPEVKAEYYFNSVYLEGAKDANGDRPTAEVKDSDAIANDGREIQVFLRDLDVTTEAGATFRAQSVLDTALSNNDLVGTIESPPNLVECGFGYSVDFGNGPNTKTLEEIALRLSNDELVASNQFTIRESFGEDISKLQRDARSLEDQV